MSVFNKKLTLIFLFVNVVEMVSQAVTEVIACLSFFFYSHHLPLSPPHRDEKIMRSNGNRGNSDSIET